MFSTVPVGTCRQVGASHFPVEGAHPEIDVDIRRNPDNFLGGTDPVVEEFLLECNLGFNVLEKPEWTEFLKLRSLAYYALCIEFARFSGKVAGELLMPWQAVRDYDEAYNWVNIGKCREDLRRMVLNPPDGKIGGHCILPGVRILCRHYPDPLLTEILFRNGEGGAYTEGG